MYCSIKRNAMLSLRIVLAAIMGLFVLVCFAQPAAPQVNIEIMVIDGADHVKISWERVEDAETYNIYSSYDPYTQDWGEPEATVGDSVFTYTTEDSVDDLGRAYFFYVTAYVEPDDPADFVLVGGTRFNVNIVIAPFHISKYQVTQEEFVNVMGEWDFHFPDNPTHPAERVSWFDAVEYCNRLSISEGLTPAYSYLGSGTNPDDWPDGWNEDAANHTNVSCDWEADGYRLPTEAEWHHAANGGVCDPESDWGLGSPYRYSGSDTIDEVAWWRNNAGGTTHPVGTKDPNGLDIYDMSGNVYEWCWDIHDNTTWPPNEDNPRGADDGTFRVVRGGSHWSWGEGSNRVTARGGSRANSAGRSEGFRVVRVIP